MIRQIPQEAKLADVVSLDAIEKAVPRETVRAVIADLGVGEQRRPAVELQSVDDVDEEQRDSRVIRPMAVHIILLGQHRHLSPTAGSILSSLVLEQQGGAGKAERTDRSRGQTVTALHAWNRAWKGCPQRRRKSHQRPHSDSDPAPPSDVPVPVNAARSQMPLWAMDAPQHSPERSCPWERQEDTRPEHLISAD